MVRNNTARPQQRSRYENDEPRAGRSRASNQNNYDYDWDEGMEPYARYEQEPRQGMDRPRDREGRFVGRHEERRPPARYGRRYEEAAANDYDDQEEQYGAGLDRSNREGGHGGWYGDAEGHRRAAQRGWENPDHGDSGWYGDAEGHRRAAQRGWEEGHRDQQRNPRRDDDERQPRERNRRYAASRY